MTHRTLIRTCLLVASLSLTGACGTLGVLGDASVPLDVYDLRAPSNTPAAQGRPLARDVIVERPTTGGVLDTDRIMIRPDALQAQYLPDARWGDDAPVMLRTLMLRTLEDTGGLRYVGREPLGISGDFAIVTELVDFQAEVAEDGESAVIVLRMTSRLVRESDATILSSRRFRATAAAASTETVALIDAFDRAADVLLLDFAGWALGALGKRLQPAS